MENMHTDVRVLGCKRLTSSKIFNNSGREIAPNTGANATKFLTLAAKS